MDLNNHYANEIIMYVTDGSKRFTDPLLIILVWKNCGACKSILKSIEGLLVRHGRHMFHAITIENSYRAAVAEKLEEASTKYSNVSNEFKALKSLASEMEHTDAFPKIIRYMQGSLNITKGNRKVPYTVHMGFQDEDALCKTFSGELTHLPCGSRK